MHWKAALHFRFNARGKKLSSKLRAEGYDSVVTTDGYGTREIMMLL
jgi:hypothetical protein